MSGKNRQARYDKTVIGGEGSDEVTFLKYVSSLYSIDDNFPRISNCHGGNPKAAVLRLRNTTPQIGAYKKRAILFDDDIGEKELEKGLKEASTPPSIECVVAHTRFECEMLKIHGISGGILKKSMKNSETAKKEFSKICNKLSDGSKMSYNKVYPKAKLDSERIKSKWLNSVISLFEN